MRTVVLCGIALLASASAFAQAGAPAAADPPEKTVTLTGCVIGATAQAPITLTNALLIPGTPQPGQLDQTPSPIPAPVSSPATEPVDPTLPPPTAAPITAAPSSVTGTAGTKTPAVTVGTSGVIAGTAPAGSSGSSVTGYRLSGADMQPWIGKRVQLIGTFVPAATGASTPTPQPPGLEFKVQTVMPATGPCSK